MTVPIVQLWTGREARALREAKRMSLVAFAGHLGVSERMLSKWEEGGEKIHPRPVNQQALDSSLSASSAEVQTRFAALVGHAVPMPAGLGGEARASSRIPESIGTLPESPPQRRHPIDGKLMVLIDAGVGLLGAEDEPVFLPAFWIDVFPTSNADYARFLAATGHQAPHHWVSQAPPEALLDHPVVFVTWNDATAYAAWSAKALPASQQWEKAARGTRGDVYPWGSQLTPAKCNVRESGIRGTTPVDRYHSGVSPYGVYDLCGNSWEWCSTHTENGRYELKGSAFTSPFSRCAPSTFNDAAAGMLDDDTGFRCVTPVETLRALMTMNG